jgi:hypothetical protein
LNRRIRSFNPIFRISNQAIAYLKDAYLSGWSGHHEVSMATLLNEGGFKINDIGGGGRFVLPGFEEKNYVTSQRDTNGDLKSGTMRFRPLISEEEIDGQFLYHPVKPGIRRKI